MDESMSFDVSMKDIYVIIYYPESDPGKEYDIRSYRELLDWTELKKGATVTIKVGYAKMQGTIISITDNYEELVKDYHSIVDDHRDELEGDRRNVPNYTLKKRVLTWMENNKEINHVSPTKSDARELLATSDSTNVEDELHKAMEEVVSAYERFHKLLTECEKSVEDLKSLNLEDITSRFRKVSTSSSGNSYSEIDKNTEKVEQQIDFNEVIRIGPNGTEIKKIVYDGIKWTNYSAATRKLLVTLFTRQVLATHSLTGKKSPAFLHSSKQPKAKLDINKVADIIHIVSKNCKVPETLVRAIITTKCSDENKMWNKRLQRNKENVSPTSQSENSST